MGVCTPQPISVITYMPRGVPDKVYTGLVRAFTDAWWQFVAVIVWKKCHRVDSLLKARSRCVFA